MQNGPLTLNYEAKTKEEKENLAWANFHNGVAAVLKIHQDSFHRNNNKTNTVGGQAK